MVQKSSFLGRADRTTKLNDGQLLLRMHRKVSAQFTSIGAKLTWLEPSLLLG